MKTFDFTLNEMPELHGSASTIRSLAACLGQIAGALIGALKRAYVRERDRAALAELDDRLLRDIGLTRAQVGLRPTHTHTSLW